MSIITIKDPNEIRRMNYNPRIIHSIIVARPNGKGRVHGNGPKRKYYFKDH
ncbi:hypothetical protein JSO59_001435 [Riemerella anatipestifer]|uniref:hypothetical protein n=1 Tax=Riemerella anatipestifer TaxID=34085 RepID=UPI0030BB3EB2